MKCKLAEKFNRVLKDNKKGGRCPEPIPTNGTQVYTVNTWILKGKAF